MTSTRVLISHCLYANQKDEPLSRAGLYAWPSHAGGNRSQEILTLLIMIFSTHTYYKRLNYYVQPSISKHLLQGLLRLVKRHDHDTRLSLSSNLKIPKQNVSHLRNIILVH